MKIRDISVRIVSVPLSRVFKGSTYQIESRCTLIVSVETDEGVTGEIYSGDERETTARSATWSWGRFGTGCLERTLSPWNGYGHACLS